MLGKIGPAQEEMDVENVVGEEGVGGVEACEVDEEKYAAS